MANNILIISIIAIVFLFVYTYSECPEGELLINCLNSKLDIVEDVSDIVWIIRVLLETL